MFTPTQLQTGTNSTRRVKASQARCNFDIPKINNILHRIPDKRQRAEGRRQQLQHALALRRLHLVQALQRVAQLGVLDEHVAVYAQEHVLERLHGLEVAVRAQALHERGEEETLVFERDERADLEVDGRGRESLDVGIEAFVCAHTYQ